MVDIPTVNKQTRTKDKAAMVFKSTDLARTVRVDRARRKGMRDHEGLCRMSKGAVDGHGCLVKPT